MLPAQQRKRWVSNLGEFNIILGEFIEESAVMRKKQHYSEVLTYQKGRRNQTTVRRCFIEWRKNQPIDLPMRCDNSNCFYHENVLTWNDQPLNLILDHINGVCGDNRPENLQFLCPNCNSQLSTNGGGNKGKVRMSGGGYSIKQQSGKNRYYMPFSPSSYAMTGFEVSCTATTSKIENDNDG